MWWLCAPTSLINLNIEINCQLFASLQQQPAAQEDKECGWWSRRTRIFMYCETLSSTRALSPTVGWQEIIGRFCTINHHQQTTRILSEWLSSWLPIRRTCKVGECNKNCHEMTPKELLQLAQGGRERGEEKERVQFVVQDKDAQECQNNSQWVAKEVKCNSTPPPLLYRLPPLLVKSTHPLTC